MHLMTIYGKINHPEEDFKKSKHVGITPIKVLTCQNKNCLTCEFLVVINYLLNNYIGTDVVEYLKVPQPKRAVHFP